MPEPRSVQAPLEAMNPCQVVCTGCKPVCAGISTISDSLQKGVPQVYPPVCLRQWISLWEISHYPKMSHLTETASQAKVDGSREKNRGILKWDLIPGTPRSVLKSKMFANLSSTRWATSVPAIHMSMRIGTPYLYWNIAISFPSSLPWVLSPRCQVPSVTYLAGTWNAALVQGHALIK